MAVCLAAASLLVCLPAGVSAQAAGQDERVAAAFVLTRGRPATTAEAERWLAQGSLSTDDLIARQRRALQEDPAAQQDVAIRAARDAFGRVTESDRRPAPEGASGTYFEQVQRHLEWLAGHPTDYEQVVQRAYRTILQRDAYSIEIDYWKRQPTLTFALLAGCVENWAMRSRPGLTATTGVPAISVNSEYLATVRLSPAIAAEARAAVGMAPVSERTLAAAVGKLVVAPGAAEVVSVGGIHFAAAGGPRLDEVLTQR